MLVKIKNSEVCDITDGVIKNIHSDKNVQWIHNLHMIYMYIIIIYTRNKCVVFYMARASTWPDKHEMIDR